MIQQIKHKPDRNVVGIYSVSRLSTLETSLLKLLTYE